ncbi:MAG: hypothetical protein JJE28_03060 [Actinomycetales bacterium]|nr:hypothetical protein [Actinomycetales bacterium]
MTRILDCTLRDGGYHTNWVFQPELVTRYLDGLSLAGITHVEMGFRFGSDTNTFGDFAYTSDSLLSEIGIPTSLIPGVMINAADFVTNGSIDLGLLTRTFRRTNSLLKFVRVAAHFEEIALASRMGDFLIDQGFEAHLNVMRISELIETPSKWRLLEGQFGSFESVTMADSLGALLPSQVPALVSLLMSETDATVGVHMHDNLGLALANTLASLEAGAQSLDATMSGMGRGAGNTRTEFLAGLLKNADGQALYNVEPLLELAASDFEPLQKKLSWGPNSIYFVSALGRVHPTYAQELLDSGNYASSEILSAMKELTLAGALSYSPQKLDAALHPERIPDSPAQIGTLLESNWCAGKRVVLIGGGRFVEENAVAIGRVLRRHKGEYVVLSMNPRSTLPKDLIDAFVVFDPFKLMLSSSELQSHKSRIITHNAPALSGAGFDSSSLEIFDRESFEELNHMHVSADKPMTLNAFSFALTVIAHGGASEIELVGFDGFPANREKHVSMQETIDRFGSRHGAEIPLLFATPSQYSGAKRSIFSR